MTNPSGTQNEATMPDEVKLRAVEQLAEHLCARRPCGDTPENVADWLDYSLNKCGLIVARTNELEALSASGNAEWQRGFFAGTEHIANFINSLDSGDMSGKQVRTAIYSECLTARPRLPAPPAEGEGE